MAGAPQGNEAPGASNGNGEQAGTPTYVTAEEVGNIVNAAVTNHLKRALPKEFETLRTGFVAELDKKLGELAKAKESAVPEDKGKPSPEVAALQTRLAELERTNKEFADKADKAEKARREEAAFGSLRAALGKSVRPEMLEIATKVVRADGLISFDESGQPLFRVRRSPGAGMPEEDQNLPLADGIAHFLKSKDAAPFLPPPKPAPGNGGGAPRPTFNGGTPPNGDRPPPKTDAERIARAAEQEAEIRARMGNNPTI